MKKFLFALAMLALTEGIQAQVNSIGPTAGFNYAWLSDNDNASARPSFNVGLIYNHSILENAGIGLEVRYSQEGSKRKIGALTYTNELSYLRIPLKFNYYFGALGDNFRPKIFVGPSFAFLIGGKSVTQVGETVIRIDSKDAYKPFDAGIQAGVGLNCRLAKLIWLNFDLAYTHGLLNVNRNNSTFEPQNRLVNINLGVAFGF